MLISMADEVNTIKQPIVKAAKTPSQPKAGEKVYTIPLGDAYKKAEGKRVPYAMRLVRKFLETLTISDDI